ncbi:hypothetical protein HELRODRAFT_159748 [Helobdella robusta]|uniref:Uncharacterized protein n=1 Tax=Helobdella robusta TaxID=6412 RepID=T1EPD0_HELRO|nr:hypothetical protein HELRODRAFT_159748 [Helobdella robusta]ESO13129.1 hypothetical protein HELRODRAFT_159748 [Helobdella robusta]
MHSNPVILKQLVHPVASAQLTGQTLCRLCVYYVIGVLEMENVDNKMLCITKYFDVKFTNRKWFLSVSHFEAHYRLTIPWTIHKRSLTVFSNLSLKKFKNLKRFGILIFRAFWLSSVYVPCKCKDYDRYDSCPSCDENITEEKSLVLHTSVVILKSSFRTGVGKLFVARAALRTI